MIEEEYILAFEQAKREALLKIKLNNVRITLLDALDALECDSPRVAKVRIIYAIQEINTPVKGE